MAAHHELLISSGEQFIYLPFSEDFLANICRDNEFQKRMGVGIV
jgi:hypothetical protein